MPLDPPSAGTTQDKPHGRLTARRYAHVRRQDALTDKWTDWRRRAEALSDQPQAVRDSQWPALRREYAELLAEQDRVDASYLSVMGGHVRARRRLKLLRLAGMVAQVSTAPRTSSRPRGRRTRTAARRAAGERAGQDPGDDDPDSERPSARPAPTRPAGFVRLGAGS
jgi:hypothetical protein